MRHVHLDLATDHKHIRQVVTGFILLARQGEIDLRITGRKRLPDTHPERSILPVEIDGQIVTYDVNDGYYLSREATERHLAGSVAYFKRSFDRAVHAKWSGAEKMHPLGLNYWVETVHPVFYRVDVGSPRMLAKSTVRSALGRERRPRVRSMQASTDGQVNRRVLFVSRVWNPTGEDSGGDLPADVQQSRSELNAMRVECVRSLRTLGPDVTAGLEPTPYAVATYPDLISPVPTFKRAHLTHVRDASICVTTRGLDDSNGWKLGEYAAFSRAIVAERPRYAIPAFNDPINYLSFDSSEQCVEAVAALRSDLDRVREMQTANMAYYECCLRPDRLIARTLDQL